jgi:hypothetical protein
MASRPPIPIRSASAPIVAAGLSTRPIPGGLALLVQLPSNHHNGAIVQVPLGGPNLLQLIQQAIPAALVGAQANALAAIKGAVCPDCVMKIARLEKNAQTPPPPSEEATADTEPAIALDEPKGDAS